MLHLFLNDVQPVNLAAGGRVLHIAPEPHVAGLMDSIPHLRRLAMDLEPDRLFQDRGRAFRGDLTRLPVHGNSVSAVFCIHVLEHIDDDSQALSEIHRILQPGGMAHIMVPIDMKMADTIDFGGPHPLVCGHYRGYGADFLDKLRLFKTQYFIPSEIFSPEDMDRYRLRDVDVVFCCGKEANCEASAS
ncbi:MAG: class I SAM-dependent methyltransferase [Candidatus Hydrogenedentales bacterium]